MVLTLREILETLRQTYCGKIGAEYMYIQSPEQKTWLQNQQTLSHTIGVLGWTADFPDAITFLDVFRTGNGNNYTGWADPAYDALCDRADATFASACATAFAVCSSWKRSAASFCCTCEPSASAFQE